MVRAGDSDDPPDAPGAARVLGRILIEPANHRSPGRFVSMSVEGDVRVVTEGDVTTFTAVTTRDRTATAIRLLAAFIETPVWNNTTLIRAVKRNGEEDRDEVPTEWERDYEIWQSRLGVDVPPPPLPDVPPRETLRSLFEACYKARSMTLAVVGDLHGIDTRAEASMFFGILPRSADTIGHRKRVPDTPARKPTDTYAFVGYRAPAVTDGLAPAMEVIPAAMGFGKTSAIFRTLRDVEGTGYESGAVYPRRLTPSGIALFSRAPGQAAKVRDDLTGIWLSAALDTRTDWGSARARAVQLYASKHQTVRDRAYWLAFWEIAGKGAEYDVDYASAISTVTDAALNAAAKTWMTGRPTVVP